MLNNLNLNAYAMAGLKVSSMGDPTVPPPFLNPEWVVRVGERVAECAGWVVQRVCGPSDPWLARSTNARNRLGEAFARGTDRASRRRCEADLSPRDGEDEAW